MKERRQRWVDGEMKGAVNQHAGVRGQEEEAGLYKPEVATLLTLWCSHPSILRPAEGKKDKEREGSHETADSTETTREVEKE